jgi:holo-[acyl-carrier-protein] synthase
VLAEGELAQWRARMQRSPERGVRFVATRFAAKEAFSKAVGLGMRSPMSWRACEVVNLPGGQPSLRWHGPLAAWCTQRRLRAHLSVSDEADIATAMVVVEQLP